MSARSYTSARPGGRPDRRRRPARRPAGASAHRASTAAQDRVQRAGASSARDDLHRSRVHPAHPRAAGGGRAPRARAGRDAVRGQPGPCADEEPDAFRTVFERDRDRIVHSKAFRRLKHKTQVFLDPEGDHFITRLSHTLQVHQIARALAAALSLNEAARGGDRAGPRRGAHAVRSHRRGGPVAVLPHDRRLAPRGAERAHLRGARGPQPDLGGARRDPGPLVEDRAAAGHPGGAVRPLRATGSRT